MFKVLEVPLSASAKATVDAVTTDVTETRPLERRVDTVLRIGQSDGEDFLLAIEAQSDKKEAKAASWAYYIAYLQDKYRLPVLLLVVCQDRATAKWAVGPFDCGTSEWTALRIYPLVAGPDNLPLITDTRTVAQKLALAVLSAVAHARNPECGAILEAIGTVLQELQETDPETVGYFAEFLEINLGSTPAGMQRKEIMSFVSYFPGRGTVRETAYFEGRAAGEAKGILFVLEARGIPVPDSVRERVTTCTDLDRMDAWLERSRTVERAEDLFAEGPEPPGTGPEAA
ncbi:hypothetical protein [Streptomyces sp. NPDC050548]|uniref:hypothetical protein n=1 Tax=Streptomyces sp. NPDC050548 TaxID=3365629 RepID=UPI00378E90F1